MDSKIVHMLEGEKRRVFFNDRTLKKKSSDIPDLWILKEQVNKNGRKSMDQSKKTTKQIGI